MTLRAGRRVEIDHSNPTVALDGEGRSFVAGTRETRLLVRAFDADGALRWQSDLGGARAFLGVFLGTVAAAGRIYLHGCTTGAGVRCLSPLGVFEWVRTYPGGPICSSLRGRT